MSKAVFISYRRIDTNWAAVALHRHIRRTFPGTEVFMDIASIEPGADFVEVINDRVDRCAVLLAVIGPNWLTVSTNQGRRRLDIETDFVRLEIARALEREIRVVPILVDGAEIPHAFEIPDVLKPLTQKNALAVRHESNERDLDTLCDFLERHLKLRRIRTLTPLTRAAPAAPTATPDHPEVGRLVAEALLDAGVDGKTMSRVASVRSGNGHHVVEEAIRRAAIDLMAQNLGMDHTTTVAERHRHAHALLNIGRSAEALAELEVLLPLARRTRDENSIDPMKIRLDHARAMLAVGRAEEARAALQGLVRAIEPMLAGRTHHPLVDAARFWIAVCDLETGAFEASVSALYDLLDAREHHFWAVRHEREIYLELCRAALECACHDDARRLLAQVPADPAQGDVVALARAALVEAWLSDAAGDAGAAEEELGRAGALLSARHPDHPIRRQLDRYRETRMPGRAGGTTLGTCG